jgi:4a-hydroxytetrahydrobiopterin dehydratase
MANRQKLSDADIQAKLSGMPGWAVADGKLHREYKFKDFVQAFGFMTSAALVSESMNHHPEWFNVYGTVNVDLATHDVGGITGLDFTLAGKMEELATAGS